MASLPSASASRTFLNIVVLVAALLVVAWLVDRSLLAFGRHAWVLCKLAGILNPVAWAIGFLMATAGFAGWLLSAFNASAMLMLGMAGLCVPHLPGILLHYIGATCGP